MIRNKREYDLLLKSGMFWEFHPELSGEWSKDELLIGTIGEEVCECCGETSKIEEMSMDELINQFTIDQQRI